MKGFLDFIASQYSRKAEDVASDVFAYLMHDSFVQNRFCDLLAELGFSNLKPGFTVETRKSGENGIPDIKLVDSTGECRVIIENKFWALLTRKQPCAYLDEIAPTGLLLFVAPRSRRSGIWEQIQARCEDARLPITHAKITSPGCTGRIGLKHIAVVSWSKLLEALSSSTSTRDTLNIPRGTEAEMFFNQLERLCGVEDSKRIEKLDERWLSNKDIALSVYDSNKLVNPIIDSAEDDNCFVPDKRQLLRSCGPGYFGKSGKLGKYQVWIGFDARLWSERGESPIWIEFTDKKQIDDELRKIFLAARGRWSWLLEPDQLRDGNDEEDYQLVIPIPLTPRVEYDEVLRRAIQRVEEVRELLDPQNMKDL